MVKTHVHVPKVDELPIPIRVAVLDFADTFGPVTAVKSLQRSLGVTADGVLGPSTMAAVRMTFLPRVQDEYAKARIRYLTALVVAQPVKTRFLTEWVNRALAFLPIPREE
jgi:lysozyme family protein